MTTIHIGNTETRPVTYNTNRNLTIIGNTGTGKNYLIKNLIKQYAEKGFKISILDHTQGADFKNEENTNVYIEKEKWGQTIEKLAMELENESSENQHLIVIPLYDTIKLELEENDPEQLEQFNTTLRKLIQKSQPNNIQFMFGLIKANYVDEIITEAGGLTIVMDNRNLKELIPDTEDKIGLGTGVLIDQTNNTKEKSSLV